MLKISKKQKLNVQLNQSRQPNMMRKRKKKAIK